MLDDVVTFAIAPNGPIYAQRPDRTLRRSSTGLNDTFGIVLDDVKEFVIGPSGAIGALRWNNSELVHSVNGQLGSYLSLADEPISRFTFGLDGAVYMLEADGPLARWHATEGREMLASERIRSVSIGTDGAVYFLEEDGGFFRSVSGRRDTFISMNSEAVSRYDFGPDGAVYMLEALEADGGLARWHHEGGGERLTSEAVRSFAIAADGTVYFLEYDGDLHRSLTGRANTLINIAGSIYYVPTRRRWDVLCVAVGRRPEPLLGQR